MIAGPAIDNFLSNINTANATQVIMMISSAFGTSTAGELSGGDQTKVACIRDIVMNSINQTDVALLVRGLNTVQRAVTTLDKIASFLYRYRMTTEFMFPSNCIRRFVELNFCQRCTRRVPPLCSNTCGALFRGCLSPYYTVLSNQFDLLWNVSRQVLRVSNNTLQNLFTNERDLIDVPSAVSIRINYDRYFLILLLLYRNVLNNYDYFF